MRKVKLKNLKTKSDVIKTFRRWSNKMDKIYKNKSDRHNAENWTDTPGNWMTPYNDDLFFIWSEYDGGSPFAARKIKIWLSGRR